VSSVSPSDEVGLSYELNQLYLSLGSDDFIYGCIKLMSETLLENCMAGNQIQRRNIPRYYVSRYGVNNLYRYRLPSGYRGIYTILVNDGKLQSWILEILDHSAYEARFGYS
jgi:hypothetical protein